jgi:hypothetical protein
MKRGVPLPPKFFLVLSRAFRSDHHVKLCKIRVSAIRHNAPPPHIFVFRCHSVICVYINAPRLRPHRIPVLSQAWKRNSVGEAAEEGDEFCCLYVMNAVNMYWTCEEHISRHDLNTIARYMWHDRMKRQLIGISLRCQS